MFFPQLVNQRLKEALVCKSKLRDRFGILPLFLCLSASGIRECGQSKVDGRARIVDFEKLEGHSEELEGAVAFPVEPVQRLAVLLTQLRTYPYHSTGIQACGVCNQLAEMCMIGGFELVLDDDDSVLIQVTRHQISREAANGRLAPDQLQVHPQNFAELGQVVRQPRRKLTSLTCPNVTGVDARQLAEMDQHETVSMKEVLPDQFGQGG